MRVILTHCQEERELLLLVEKLMLRTPVIVILNSNLEAKIGIFIAIL